MSKSTRSIILATVALFLIGAGIYLFNGDEGASATQVTDDAYLRADFTVVAPRITGEVAALHVEDYQPVNAGDPLVDIDDRDLKLALQQAEAEQARAEAQVDTLAQQIERQKSQVAKALAVIEVDRSKLTLAKADFQRFSNLANEGSGTRQAKERARAELDGLKATAARDEAELNAARQQVEVLKAQLKAAEAGQAASVSAVDNAKLQLSYAHIAAPVSGVVAQRRARVGGYVHPGDALLALVPLDQIYVQANFRETQLTHMQPGQKVSISVDSFPDLELEGVVDNIGPASSVSFSPVAPHNATGNFTKIVQRLPVKIRLTSAPEKLASLRVGMSVITQVQVR
ncbi:HlyD family secretion protein [Marinobacterium lutimaris]|uniref:Membrane fusion protein, multidrug efflux system n=1 Tax=Marinobacterium lutimaris TaxID=568106 RepID=A0A1H6D006_9GAMM|nr:HlyD family secretion protein [Marinobacterium lutimaris]SEG78233.1 membrane fusion protein, multidrug efflux system [Marinobacterium lutimaris]